MEHRYQYEIAGTNARMSDVNAAIARSQLRRLAAANQARRANAAALTSNLAALPGLTLPAVPAGAVHAWNQYTIVADRRADKLQIRQAVQELFKVKVIKVNTLNVRGKVRRKRTPFEGNAPSWKKAIVTLRKEDKITLT